MSIQVNILLLLAGAIQGMLLSLVLVRKKTYRHGYGFLIGYLMVMIAQVLFKVLDKQWLIQGNSTAYFLSYKFPFLYGPLTWLFIRRLTENNNKWSWKDLWHFVPFVYSMVMLNTRNVPGFLAWPMEAAPALVLQIVSLVLYHSMAYRLWTSHNRQMQETCSDLHSFKIQWINQFIISSLFICIAISIFTYFIYIWYPAHNWLRFGFLLLVVFIYRTSFSALMQPQIFTPFHKPVVPGAENPLVIFPPFVVHRPAIKYAHSTLSDKETARILSGLKSLMQRERLFTEPQLNIDQLVTRLQTNRYQLSQVLNQSLGQSFYAYINSWRIAAAKEMLADPAFHDQKIASIGYDAGFNSLSTFNDVFKKITGLTPSQFKKQVVEEKGKLRV